VDAQDYRRLMGFWATGVSVVTAQGSDGPAGATANALTSLSLTPPRALVCFDVSSRTLHAVRESERFAVNVLAAGQEQIARVFATKASQEDKFALVSFRDRHGAPTIEGSLAWFVCALDSELKQGDHIVAFGRVLAGGFDELAEPLLYYRSSYLPLNGKESPGER
jgi:3-hydroxy-9,10-secoandrosta-1,3,5(10)-triene-9,17-dione monooxygenase reductase component